MAFNAARRWRAEAENGVCVVVGWMIAVWVAAYKLLVWVLSLSLAGEEGQWSLS